MAKSFKEFFAQGQRLDLGNRQKIDSKEVLNKELTIIDFSLIRAKHGDSAIVITKEYPDGFFFAPSILTAMLHDVSENEEMNAALHFEGMKIKIYEKKSKDGSRTYMAVDVI